jgi:hypothetical protein
LVHEASKAELDVERQPGFKVTDNGMVVGQNVVGLLTDLKTAIERDRADRANSSTISRHYGSVCYSTSDNRAWTSSV